MLILYFTGVILSKKCQGEGLKKVLKKGERRDLPYKGGFLKKGGLNLRAMHLKENYKMEEFYFSLSDYPIIHSFSILFKRYLVICLNLVYLEIIFND